MKKQLWAYLGLSTIAIIWGASFGINRLATESLHPLLFIFFRFGFAVPLLFLLLKLTEGSIGIAKSDLLTLALIGFFGVTIMENAIIYSIQYTSLANASLLNTAPWPILTALFAPFFTKERITRRLLLGGALAMVGVSLIILAGGGEGSSLPVGHLRGDLLALLVSLLGALYNLACMPLMQRYSPLRVSAWFILFGVILMVPLTWNLWTEVEWNSLGVAVWFGVGYNTLLCTVAAFVIWNWGMKLIGAARANFFRYLVPAAAVVAGYFMYSETIALWQIIGGLLMAGGLVWISSENKGAEIPESVAEAVA